MKWLIAELVTEPAGRTRLLKVATGTRYDEEVRILAARALFDASPDAATLAALAATAPLEKWDGKGTANLWVLATSALFQRNPTEAFTRLSPLLQDVSGAGNKARAEALMRAMPKQDLDPQWSAGLVPLLEQSDAFLRIGANEALLALPPDERVIEPILKRAGKNPAKASFGGNELEVLARLANARILPYLVAQLHQSWTNFPVAFEGFRTARDPAMIPVIEAWLKQHGDGPKGDRTRRGNAIIAELRTCGPVPVAAVAAAAAAAKPAPKTRSKPKTLAFKKGPKPKQREKVEPLAAQRKTFAAMFEEAGLAKHAAALLQPSARLYTTRVELKSLALGESRIGGLPDLPADIPWPSVKKEPLSFVAQLDLAEVGKHLGKTALPKQGHLVFFVSADPDGEGGYLETAKVLFLERGAKLVRRELPEGYAGDVYRACRVAMAAMLKVPSGSHKRVTRLLKGKAYTAYQDHVDVAMNLAHQVLGYRDHEWEAEHAADAQLLFQCISDEQADMTWGDDETLSFFIREKDLAAGTFSKVWPYFGD